MSENKGISRRKKTRNKLSLLVASMILIAVFGVFGTVAYLTTKTDSITNTFTASTITPGIEEKFDGETKSDVKLKNLGDIDAYIRAAVVISWVSEDGSKVSADVPTSADYTMAGPADGWVKSTDGYYYYTSKVGADQSTKNLINSVKLEDGVTPPEGYYFSVEILAQAIQADPASVVTSVWSSGVSGVNNNGELEIKTITTTQSISLNE